MSYFDWEAVEDPEPDWHGHFRVRIPLLDERYERDWAEAFVELANPSGVRAGSWGDVSIRGADVEIEGVAPGSETALRRFLEDAASQADGLAQRERSRSAEMGERFRSPNERRPPTA